MVAGWQMAAITNLEQTVIATIDPLDNKVGSNHNQLHKMILCGAS